MKTKIQDNLWPQYLSNKYKLIFELMDKFAQAKLQEKDLLACFGVIMGTLQ